MKSNRNVIVGDHCPWTGKFRGAAHQQCNIMYRKTYENPCFFQNFGGYDSHHIFQHLSNLDEAPTVIAKNLEKFTAMEIYGVVMKDSMQFLNCSLDKLVTNLKEKGKKDGKTLKEILPTTYFKEKWGEVDEQAFSLLCKKGV